MEESKKSQLNEILHLYVAKRQVDVASSLIEYFYDRDCFARSGKQAFITEVKLEGVPRATIYRIASRLESLGFIDRESRFSGYFLSHGFSTKREAESTFWRHLLKT